MSAVFDSTLRPAAISPPLVAWAAIALGIALVYAPTVYWLATTLWNDEAQAHGPIVLVVVLGMSWWLRSAYLEEQGRPLPYLGGLVLTLGLLAYVVGRSQGIAVLEVGSVIPVLIGVLLVLRGLQAVRRLWFPLFFLFFMVPLPGFLLDAMTGPLKGHVSAVVANVLYAAGYPIGRSGVVLSIGQYELLVADACSGLHSMFSLSAMGLLYIYLMRYPGVARNAILAASILPTAFLANVIRVIILVLVTYYYGDAAGQGFIHGFAGMFLFVVALLTLFVIDWMLGFVFPARSKRA